ncbi:MAG TPA: MlaD family protein [Baekduia sp.]|nr:MlaD family protein [Baekduia sp.]
MNTEKLGVRRILVVAVFSLTCFGLMLYLWNAFGGSVPLKPRGYRVVVALPEADLLAQEADVRISGVSVGRVVRTEPSPVANRKDAVVELDARYAPLRADVRATIRRKSLAGEEYLELTPGGRRAAAVPDGGRLASARVAPSVEIDEVLRALDAPTRRALASWIQSQATALGDRGADLNAALGNLPGFEEDLTALLKTLNGQSGAVRAAVSNTGVVFDALSARRGALRGAIVNGERATRALAARSQDIAATFRALPAFETESRRLLERAERFRRSADPVVAALRPGARAFSAAVADAPATAKELDGLAHGLAALSPAARRGLPATQRFFDRARPFVAQFAPFLDQLQPALAYIAPQAQSLSALVANLTAATQGTAAGYGSNGAPVHFARVGMALNPGSLAQYGTRRPWMRANAYESGDVGFGAGRPLTLFDTRGCRDAVAFPKIVETPGTADVFSAQMIERIRHFVLDDEQGRATPCLLQPTPQGATSFPQIRPLSHTSGDR